MLAALVLGGIEMDDLAVAVAALMLMALTLALFAPLKLLARLLGRGAYSRVRQSELAVLDFLNHGGFHPVEVDDGHADRGDRATSRRRREQTQHLHGDGHVADRSNRMRESLLEAQRQQDRSPSNHVLRGAPRIKASRHIAPEQDSRG